MGAKKVAKRTYDYLVEVCGDPKSAFDYKNKVVDAVKGDSKRLDLKGLGIKGELLEDIIDCTETDDGRNIFIANMYIDWHDYFKNVK